MIIRFEKEYLRDLYETGKCNDKKHRFQKSVIRQYQHCISKLETAQFAENLYCMNSLHYEVLKGDKAGISSVRVNQQYRIEFTVHGEGIESVLSICRILELSNHYK